MQIAAVRLTEGVNEAICTRWLSCLPGKRQEEILRRQRPKDRERSLSGEILARAMLARELRCPLRDSSNLPGNARKAGFKRLYKPLF